MKIITKLSTLDVEYPCENASTTAWQELMGEIISSISMNYTAETGCGEAYLPVFSELWDIQYGCKNPDIIKRTANSWNGEIRTAFYNCVNKVFENGFSIWTMHVDDDVTFSMMHAAMELNDNWHAFSDHAVYLENDCGYPYFRCILSPQQEKDIQEHPEEYILITVNPKS